MSVLDVLSKYSDGKIDQAIFDEIKKEAETDDAAAKKVSHDKGKENSSLRERLRKAKGYITKLGFDPEGEDIETKIDDHIGKSKTTTSTLEQKVNMLLKKVEDKEKSEATLQAKLNNKTIADGLRKALRAGNTPVIEDIEDLVVESYLNSGRAKVIDDQVIFDDATDIETEVNTYREKNPGRFRIKQNEGSGSSGSSQQPVNNTMKSDAFSRLPAKERAGLMQKEGFKLID